MKSSTDVAQTKSRVENIVAGYVQLFPEEYAATVEQVKQSRGNQLTDTAAVAGDHVLERAQYEIPETLHSAIYSKLSPEQYMLFRERSMGRWFAKRFPEFSLSETI